MNGRYQEHVAVMKKYTLTTILLICTIIVTVTNESIYAQPDILWTKTYGGNRLDLTAFVVQTPDGGYAMAGRTESFGAGDGDVWLIRADANGDTIWTRTFGGSEDDWGNSGQQTSDGGYIITGRTESFGAGATDVWLIRTDTNGNTLWTKTYGGSRNDWGNSVQQTSDGGYVITGQTESFASDSKDVWLIRTDINGNILWTKTFGESNQDDRGFSVEQTSDGGYIIAGWMGTSGDYDAFLIRTDADGNSLWLRTIGGSEDDWANSVKQTFDRGFIMTGVTQSFGAGSGDVWLIRTDANGDTLWTKTFGGSNYEEGHSLQQTSDGGFIIAGRNNGFGVGIADVWLIRTDENGEMLWTKAIDGSADDIGLSVQQTSDGGYVIAGATNGFNGDDQITFDAWLIRLAPDSNIVSVELDDPFIPAEFILRQNYPNPFNPSTTIRYSISKPGLIEIKIYDALGRLVQTLVNEKKAVGEYSAVWDGRDDSGKFVATGVYFYTLKAGEDALISKRMIMLK